MSLNDLNFNTFSTTYLILKIRFSDLETAYTSYLPLVRNKSSELGPPQTVYPEILVIMDHALYS